MDEYEYLVEVNQIGQAFWRPAMTSQWSDEETALRRFKTFVTMEKGIVEHGHHRRFQYRIVRRPVGSITVYLEEGDVI